MKAEAGAENDVEKIAFSCMQDQIDHKQWMHNQNHKKKIISIASKTKGKSKRSRKSCLVGGRATQQTHLRTQLLYKLSAQLGGIR